MATVEGLNLRGTRYYIRIVIPTDLQDTYGKARVNVSLGTSDRKEAIQKGHLERARWLEEFTAHRATLKPAPIAVIPPAVAEVLAQRIRAHILAGDDQLRADLPLLSELAHARSELKKLRAPGGGLRIPQWTPPAQYRDALEGATAEELDMLALINAEAEGTAAISLARGNLAAILPMVKAEAAKLGIAFDTSTPGAREALLSSLRAYRTAHREVTQRDAGEVVETPRQLPTLPTAPGSDTRKLRDVFDRWKVSGDSPRSKDAVQAVERALRQFEGEHPKVLLKDITRNLGDGYRTWLVGQSATRKTARDKFTALKTLLKYACRTLEWTPRHTWEGLDIKAKTTNKRRPWADAELSALFSTALHTAHVLPEGSYAGKDAAYWIPLLGAFTGARLGELCQLQVKDVRMDGDIAVIDITDDGEGQQVKTEAGIRSVPVHSELLRLGFMGYAEAMRKAGHTSLWPSLKLRTGKPSDYYGRWFRGLRKGSELKPTFHYFRHTVRPMMRRAGFSDSTQDKVTGHETLGSVGTVEYDHWQLQELQPAIEAIRYPFLTLPVVSPYATLKATY